MRQSYFNKTSKLCNKNMTSHMETKFKLTYGLTYGITYGLTFKTLHMEERN